VKASTAGSTQRQASRLGRFFRGGLATRASAHGVNGSGASSAGRPTPARSLFGLACLALLALAALLAGGASSAAGAEECPNEIRRTEQGVAAVALPDCRAYENATPESRPHASSDGLIEGIRVSLDGGKVGYRSKYPKSGQASGQIYLTRRGSGGWAAEVVIPQETSSTAGTFACLPWAFFSADFSKSILEEDFNVFETTVQGGLGEGFCESNQAVLDPREVKGYRNLFSHQVADGTYAGYELVSLNPAEGLPGNSFFDAGSEDLSTIVFRSEGFLTSDAPPHSGPPPGQHNTYIWSGGQVRLATYLPDGTPVQAPLAQSQGGGGYEFDNAVADDGSSLLFLYSGGIYVRINPTQPQSAISGGECTEPAMACTMRVDESQGPGASGGSYFEFATDDGSKVFFTSDHKLTVDSTAVAGREDLYEYDVETGALSDLTVNASEPAGVWALSDASADGSYIYFVAEAALEGSAAALPGNCERYEAGNACNLYVQHEGVTTFIAALSVKDTSDFKGDRFLPANPNGQLVAHHELSNLSSVESSRNGRYLAFKTVQDLDGEGAGVFFYDAVADQLSCVTCGQGVQSDREIDPTSQYGIAHTAWRTNQVLDDGTLFFTTSGALVGADTNGVGDAYEYRGGQVRLLSTGTDPSKSTFAGADPSGDNAFFITAGSILPSDRDGGGLTIYDARIGGGFPEPPPLPGCEGEACRGSGTSAPSAAATGTAAFQGAGNLNQRHKRNCRIAARRAQKVSRVAKRLRRKAKRVHNRRLSRRLRHRSVTLAKKSRRLSKGAKRCRRANRRAGK